MVVMTSWKLAPESRYGTTLTLLASSSLSVMLALVLACNGSVQAPSGGPDIVASCDQGAVTGESRIRRLTPAQYLNTVRELFADDSINLPLGEDKSEIISALAARKFDDASNALATRGVTLMETLPACATKNQACADDFIESFASRAFRRPLLDEERVWLRDRFLQAQTEFSFDESIQILTATVLGSPEFLYLAPVGEASDQAASGVLQLTGYEMAERMSYFLWDSLPDEALLVAASDGSLLSSQGVLEHAERMLQSPKAEAMVRDFGEEWLQINGGLVHRGLDEVSKDALLYPEMSSALRLAMRTEYDAFINKIFFEGGSIDDLFNSTSAYVNGSLAELYGVVGPTTDDDWQWVELNSDERAGILTRAAFLTVFSNAKVQSPVYRGVQVLRQVLCYNQPPPPPNVDDRPIEPSDGPQTVRELVEIRTQGQECQACHQNINNIGFAFENYDALGRFHTVEADSGLPIDPSGELVLSGNMDGPVANAIELSSALGASEQASACLTELWFQHALKRVPSDLDLCAMDAIRAQVQAQPELKSLLLAIVASDGFRFINAGTNQ